MSDRASDDKKDEGAEAIDASASSSLRQRGQKKRTSRKKERTDANDETTTAAATTTAQDESNAPADDDDQVDDDNNNGKIKNTRQDLLRTTHVIQVRIDGPREEHHADDNMVVDNSAAPSSGSSLLKHKKKRSSRSTPSRGSTAEQSLRSIAHDTTIKLDMPDYDDGIDDDDDDVSEEMIYRSASMPKKGLSREVSDDGEALFSAHSDEKSQQHHQHSHGHESSGLKRVSHHHEIDFVQLIARAIVRGKEGTRDNGGSSASDSESSEWHDDDLAEERAMKERATRRSKRQRLKDLRYSFSPATFARHHGEPSDDSSEESSEVHAELNHYREFLSKTDAVIRKVRPTDDSLQILVFGRDRSFKAVTLDTVIAIGNALCSNERTRDPIPQTNDVVWIDFANHTADDVKQIRLAFGLYPVTVEDCAHAPQGLTASDKNAAKRNDREHPLREKVEFFRRYCVVVTGELDETPPSDQNALDNELANQRVGNYAVARITIVTMAHVVLTFRQLRAPSFLPLVHRLMRGQHRGVVPSSTWPLMTYLDESLAHLGNLVAEMVYEIDDLNEKVLTEHRGSQDLLLRRLSYARRGLLALRVTTLAKHDLLELMRKQPIFTNDAAAISDMLDDVNSTIGYLTMAFDVLNHLDDTFLNRINLEVAISGETMNTVMKRFSAVATIFLPLTTIGSIWGMNMYVPGESMGDGDYLTFGLVVGMMAVLAFTAAFILWRNGWF